ncbi:hypothetical protein HYR69_00290 [Candidatus Sumerlaeota bacterium]|nr:hypothetical protein [Candidatus Sumerlaeota bacterium]
MAKKKDKDTWSLRPGDLPSDRILALEPRLRGLENNPYFRLCVRGGRKFRWREEIMKYIMPVACFVYTGMPYMVLWSVKRRYDVDRYLMYCLLLIALGFISALLYFSAGVAKTWLIDPAKVDLLEVLSSDHTKTHPFNLTQEFTLTLLMAGYPAEDLAIGVWGGALRKRMRAIQKGIVWSLSLTSVFAYLFGLAGVRLAVLVPITVSAYLVVLDSFNPHHALIGGKILVGWQRRISLSNTRSTFELVMPPFLGIFCTVSGMYLLLPIIRHYFFVAIRGFEPDFASRLIDSPLSALALVILGGTLGWIHGAYLRRNADRILKRMSDDIALTFKLWLEREGEKPTLGTRGKA